MERVIVSKEIENIVDKEKILGDDNLNKLPIDLHIGDFLVSSILEKISIDPHSTEFHFFISTDNILKILFSNDKKKIIINDMKSFTCNTFKSVSFERLKDMYLCKIIIDNLE